MQEFIVYLYILSVKLIILELTSVARKCDTLFPHLGL